MALLCAVLPVGLLAALMIITSRSGVVYEQEIISQVRQSVTDQVELSIEAQAGSVDSRLQRVGLSVLLLQAHAQEALRVPEAFGTAPAPASTADAAGAPPTDKTPATNSTPATADNPVYYSKDANGALHKVIDDGGATVFYAARPDGRDFTKYELQRAYSSATLDPLLKKPVDSDALCAQCYVLTSDNLLRTYPWRDLSTWPADKDLTKLSMYAWSKEKADQTGLVWTAPYFSLLLNKWVVACLAGVELGGRKVAVTGCEIPLSMVPEQLLGFSLGSGGICWLQRSSDSKTLIMLATQPGGEQLLNVIPLAQAATPDDKLPGPQILEKANIKSSPNGEVKQVLSGNEMNQTLVHELPPAHEGRFLALVPLSIPQWSLAGVVTSEAVASAYRYQRYVETRLQQRLIIALGTLLLALALAFLLSWVEARKIAQPINVLTLRLRQSIRSQTTAPIVIADNGELGALTSLVQDVLDTAYPTKPSELSEAGAEQQPAKADGS